MVCSNGSGYSPRCDVLSQPALRASVIRSALSGPGRHLQPEPLMQTFSVFAARSKHRKDHLGGEFQATLPMAFPLNCSAPHFLPA